MAAPTLRLIHTVPQYSQCYPNGSGHALYAQYEGAISIGVNLYTFGVAVGPPNAEFGPRNGALGPRNH